MSNITGTVRAKLQEAKNPKVYNVLMPLANTKYSQTLTDGTKKLTVKVREIAELKFSFSVDPEFISIPKGCSASIEGISYTGDIFFECSKANCTLEILEWS